MPGRNGTGPLGNDSIRGGGRMRGPLAAGPGGNCVCPKCNHKVPHIAGQPCSVRVCPECGTKMVRE